MLSHAESKNIMLIVNMLTAYKMVIYLLRIKTNQKILHNYLPRRKKLWPKLKQAREDGKVAFFDKREPDKLYINGILST